MDKTNALRHGAKTALLLQDKKGDTWTTSSGQTLIDLSGASLVQSLLPSDEAIPIENLRRVMPSSGMETCSQRAFEERLIMQAGPACGGLLWAASGSDAVESALWSLMEIASSSLSETAFVVGEGSYHGSTWLTRGLSSRTGTQVPELHRWVLKAPLQCSELTGLIQQLKQSFKLVVVILESVPTTGQVFYDPLFVAETIRSCKALGASIILDEVASGFYRHGWLSFFSKATTTPPDAVVLSKGLSCGLLPGSCVLLEKSVAAQLRACCAKPRNFTYGLYEALAYVGLKNLTTFQELAATGFFERRSGRIQRWIQVFKQYGTFVWECSPTTLRITASPEEASQLMSTMRKFGLHTYTTEGILNGKRWSFLLICPAFNLSEDDFEQRMETIHLALEEYHENSIHPAR